MFTPKERERVSAVGAVVAVVFLILLYFILLHALTH